MMRGLSGHLKGADREMRNRTRESALKAAIRGQEAMEYTIMHTPSSIVPGKSHRIDTGLMFDSLDAKVTETGHKITIRFGWLNKRKKYFMVQEHGGNLGSIQITGMFALRAGQRAAQRELEKVNAR